MDDPQNKPDLSRQNLMIFRQALIMLIGVLDKMLGLERTIPDKEDRALLKRVKDYQEK